MSWQVFLRLGVVFVAVLRKVIKIKRDKFFALHAQINENVRKTRSFNTKDFFKIWRDKYLQFSNLACLFCFLMWSPHLSTPFYGLYFNHHYTQLHVPIHNGPLFTASMYCFYTPVLWLAGTYSVLWALFRVPEKKRLF